MKSILIILFVAFSFQISAQDELATTIVKKGQKVPAFTFTDENGKTFSISDFKGKVVMITFFATWCAPCRQELPHIQSDIYDKYKENSQFKLLIFGREHSQKEVNDFKAAQGFTMPFYADKNRTVYSLFAEKYIPRNFLIDKNGTIIFSETGFNNEKFTELKNLIQQQVQ